MMKRLWTEKLRVCQRSVLMVDDQFGYRGDDGPLRAKGRLKWGKWRFEGVDS